MFALNAGPEYEREGALVPLDDLVNGASPQSRAEDWHVTVSNDKERLTYKANVFIAKAHRF